jgi:hypothetical protein
MNLTSGATEFRNSVRQQKSPYSIFAVKLPVEELVTELQNRFRIEDWQHNIERKGKLSDLVGVPIVKFKDSPWSIVYWSIGRYLAEVLNARAHTSYKWVHHSCERVLL